MMTNYNDTAKWYWAWGDSTSFGALIFYIYKNNIKKTGELPSLWWFGKRRNYSWLIESGLSHDTNIIWGLRATDLMKGRLIVGWRFPARQSQQQPRRYKYRFSSVQDGIYALGKAHMRSTRSLRSFLNVAFETVPMFVWLTMALTIKKRLATLPLKRFQCSSDWQWPQISCSG